MADGTSDRCIDLLVGHPVDAFGDVYGLCGRTAESPPLTLGHATPDAVLLARLERVVQAMTAHWTPSTDGTGGGGVGARRRKEQFRIGGAATSGI